MDITSDSLGLDSFKGLFLIAGVPASSALLLFFLNFLYQNREIFATDDSIWKKFSAIAKIFGEEKDNSNVKSENPSEGNVRQTATLFAASETSPEVLPNLPFQSIDVRISDCLGASLHLKDSLQQNLELQFMKTEERLNRALQDIVQR